MSVSSAFDPAFEIPCNGAGQSRPGVPPSDQVIVFARFPEPGQVKTRPIPALGPESAARRQTTLTRLIPDACQEKIAAVQSVNVEIWFAGGDSVRMSELVGGNYRHNRQHVADLGERLNHAVAAAFAEDARCVLVIGTDYPIIDARLSDKALVALDTAEVVLGPALDGGYYLIALRSARPELFQGIDWSTAKVLRQTLEIARRANLRICQLPPLSDVDIAEDILIFRRVCESFLDVLPEIQRGTVYVIVLTLNEAEWLEQSLKPLAKLPGVEVIIADGGSTDATIDIANRMGFRVVSARSGCGRQLNAGAALASGEVLLFLHVDTQLPAEFQSHMGFVINGGAMAGAFRLGIDAMRRGLRWIEWGANLRSRFLQALYGDQGLFLWAEAIQHLRGFLHWRFMEDCGFSRRLRRYGRIQLAQVAVSTSARRWLKLGLWQTTLINQTCRIGLRCGIAPERLVRWYVRRASRTL